MLLLLMMTGMAIASCGSLVECFDFVISMTVATIVAKSSDGGASNLYMLKRILQDVLGV